MSSQPDLLGSLLRDVSRAFYLTLRVLPPGVRRPVGLAYLLARAADTLADTPALPPEVRLGHLGDFRALVEGPVRPEVVQRLQREARAGTPGEEALLQALPRALELLEALDGPDRVEVRRVVDTLTRGMDLDLRTFPGALQRAEELDHYTYLVAGCVGEFWTRETMAHTPALGGWDEERMARLGIRFGKALQLTNILRDVPKDLAAGRCYLPAAELAEVGLEPRDLEDPRNLSRARPVLERQVRLALDHYAAAEEYTLALPPSCVRLRLAVLWPILIGLETLALLVRSPRWLDPADRVKVGRSGVYRIVLLSVPAAPFNPVLRAWMARGRGRVLEALAAS